MEHKIISMNKEQKQEETKGQPIGQGVIFIKTRMSDDKIHEMVSQMQHFADITDLRIMDVIIDEYASDDIDRDEVTRLCDWIESSGAGVIFVNSIYDITTDCDDLDKFIERAMYFGMIIVDFTAQEVIVPYREGGR